MEVQVEGRRLSLSNLDKVLYPETGFTKGQVIDYYTRIAPVLLPHLRGRPLTMKRYPNGVDEKYFYEKQRPKHAPDWVQSVSVEGHRDGRVIDYILADDLPTLVWLANMADLEMHPSLSLAKDTGRPTVLAFDLDPGPPATIVECAEVALILREVFSELKLECFPKASGSKGMQVYVPLNNKKATYDQTKSVSRSLAQMLERQHPELVVSKMKKELRGGKVFMDWSQNDRYKTTVSVYSLRATAQPTVSAPLSWDEVEALTEDRDPEAARFQAGELLERVDDVGDLFAPVAELVQQLPDL
ncbi:MAG: bifunctional non-ous end joining protein LigD [Thermoleophilaceae bacterium]|nr:bifunctional non-ous end joining protein LigD [Thermoleophilaceae bacterium]